MVLLLQDDMRIWAASSERFLFLKFCLTICKKGEEAVYEGGEVVVLMGGLIDPFVLEG